MEDTPLCSDDVYTVHNVSGVALVCALLMCVRFGGRASIGELEQHFDVSLKWRVALVARNRFTARCAAKRSAAAIGCRLNMLRLMSDSAVSVAGVISKSDRSRTCHCSSCLCTSLTK